MDFKAPPAAACAPLLHAACGAAAGVFLADALEPPLSAGLGVAAFCIVYAALRPGRPAVLLAVLSVFAAAHLWRHVHGPSRASGGRLQQTAARTFEMTGRVLEVPQPSARSSYAPGCRFRFRVETVRPAGILLEGSDLLVHWTGPAPGCGDRVRVRAAVKPVERPRNPGQFDKAQFWMRQGVRAEAFLGNPLDGCVLQPAGGWNVKTLAAGARAAMEAQLRRGIEDRPQTQALISSMVLGVRGDSLLEARDWFRDTGTLHLFAVSGLNLSMLAGFVAWILRLSGVGPHGRALGTLPLLLCYGIVTGLGPSCVRALVMSGMLLAVVWTDRPATALNSLGAAALLLLALDGNVLFQGGFQLSFGLVLTLAFCAAPVAKRMHGLWEPDALLPRRLWNARQRGLLACMRPVSNAFSATLVTWLAGLPWSVVLFRQVTPVALFANLFAVPVAFLNLSLGFLALLCAPFGSITPALNRANAACAEALLDFVHWAGALPGGHWPVGDPFAQTPNLTVFDTGEGGAVLLRDRGRVWLLDCGSEKQAASVILPALQGYGITRLDGLLLSHGDASHIGGALGIWEALRPGRVVEGVLPDRSPARRRLHQWLEACGGSVRGLGTGDAWEEAPGCRMEVLYPPPGLRAAVADDKGLVVRWSTPEWSVLYTADAGFPTESWLLENARERLRSDVWVRGSHGREATGGEAFVRSVGARLIVVAGARGGRGGADGQRLRRWAERWRADGVAVWLQAECGAVEGWSGSRSRFRGICGGQLDGWRSVP
jgi:ComEC/Rec2-related protein